MRVHPKVAREHQIEEELLTQFRIVDQKAQLSQQLDCLAVHRGNIRVLHRQGAHCVQKDLEEGR